MKGNKKEKNVNQKKGISLIVLVITIIVIVILAVAVILSIADNNPISNANKAKFQNDVKSIQEELELTKAKNYADNSGKSYGTILIEDLKGAEKYKDKFVIKDGELRYLSNKLSGEEKNWATELGIEAGGTVIDESIEGVTIDESGVLTTNWSSEGFPSDIGSDIVVPEKVTSIGDGAFSRCSSLTSITLPSTLTSIGVGAFSGCSSLREITIPNCVTRIHNNTFGSCGSLKEITIPEGVTEIDGGAFWSSGLEKITLPSTISDLTAVFFGCDALKSIIINGESRFTKTYIVDIGIANDSVEISGSGYKAE